MSNNLEVGQVAPEGINDTFYKTFTGDSKKRLKNRVIVAYRARAGKVQKKAPYKRLLIANQ